MTTTDPDLSADRSGPFASAWRRKHLTVDERIARGRTARQNVPRSSHGRWEPAADRPDPVALLEEQGATRGDRMRRAAGMGALDAWYEHLGKGDAFDQAVADFSAVYADQNERDYETFAAAINSGRLVARTGV